MLQLRIQRKAVNTLTEVEIALQETRIKGEYETIDDIATGTIAFIDLNGLFVSVDRHTNEKETTWKKLTKEQTTIVRWLCVNEALN